MHERGQQQEIGGRAVARGRNVVDHRDPQQRLHVHVVGMQLERISEEDHEIVLAPHDGRAHPHILNVPATCTWTAS